MVWWKAVSNTATFFSASREDLERGTDTDEVSRVVQRGDTEWRLRCRRSRHHRCARSGRTARHRARCGGRWRPVARTVSDPERQDVTHDVVQGFLVSGTGAQHGFALDSPWSFHLIRASSRLKHSARPDSMSSPVSASITANFREELPQLSRNSDVPDRPAANHWRKNWAYKG
jgi:hypothetical protein